MQRFVRIQSNKRIVATVLILVAIIGLYGWINFVEPDCHFSDKVGLQIRLCGENYAGRENSAKLWKPATFLTLLAVGFAVRVRARPESDAHLDPRSDSATDPDRWQRQVVHDRMDCS